MQLRKGIFVLASCLCLTFNSLASEYDEIIDFYGIESTEELEEALEMYGIIKYEYDINNYEDLDNALYTYKYFDEALEEEGRPRLSDSQRWALDDINEKASVEIEIAHEEGISDCLKGIFICVVLVFILGATVGKDYVSSHFI